MRLRQLTLHRYGHLADVTLDFPATPGLAIVLGANEAGKSTALAAISDALFGFPHRTDYAFRHDTNALRVGIILQAADGREAGFIRRKARKDDLLDAAGNPVPASALAVFLGGATRERFETVFGLNAARLRAGGEALLRDQGNAASTIIGAFAGARDYPAIIKSLNDEAAKLFGDGRGTRALHEARRRYDEAKRGVRETRIAPELWAQKNTELEKLAQTAQTLRETTIALSVERVRLERIRRTTPYRRNLTEARAAQAALGKLPDLPKDTADRLQKARAARDEARRDRDREAENLAKAEAALASLPARDAIADREDALDRLSAGRTAYEQSVRDLPEQTLLAEQKSAEMEIEAASLGLARSASELAANLPTRLDLERASKTLDAFAKAEARWQSLADQATEAARHQQQCAQSLSTLPEPPPAEALRGAIDRARAQGKLDDDLARAEQNRDRARDALADALAALPLWPHDAEALARCEIPLDAARNAASDRLAKAESERDQATIALARLDQTLVDLDAAIAAATITGDLPTDAAIAAARARRDAAWAVIRRAYLDQGAPITEAERAETGLGPETAPGFTHLLHEADRLVDNRAQVQERVVRLEQDQRRRAETTQLRAHALSRQQAAQAAHAAAWTSWAEIWAPSGVSPQSPPEMNAWLAARQTVLDKRAIWRERVADADALRTRRCDALADLLACLPETSLAEPSLTSLITQAEWLCKDREAKHQALQDARRALREAEQAAQKMAAAAAAGKDALAQSAKAWAGAAKQLDLPETTEPALGRTVLQTWSRIAEAAAARATARDRVQRMQAAITAYAEQARTLAKQLAPDAAGEPPLDLVKQFQARLAAAQATETERAKLNEAIAALRPGIMRHNQTCAEADAFIDDLRRAAGAADEAALDAVIERCRQARELQDTISREQAKLREADDGLSEAALAEEAAEIAFDTITARLAEIDQEIDLISQKREENQRVLTEREQEMAALQKNNDAATAAQAMETARADIEDAVRRYPPLRMAETLLREGIETFRRQQQAPLLTRAGALFSALTQDRYTALDVADGDAASLAVVACKADGSSCPAGHLSEGTRDQLHLALRLAALENELTDAEPLPFIGDDLLVNFDDQRAAAALSVLAEFSARTQIILFSHHDHIADLVKQGTAALIRLST